MLTTQILAYYNHLLATTVLYFTIVDPMQELSNSLNQQLEITDSHYHLPTLALATEETNRDYYEILGVTKDATKQEIHKAFRQQAKKYHPDKNKEKGAQDEFIKIFKAYETLSDEKKRKEYDDRSSSNQGGWHKASSGMNDFDINEFFHHYEDQLFKHANHFQNHQHQHDSHHHRHHQNQHFSFHGIDLEDLFHDIDEDEFNSFGRMFNFHNHNHHHTHDEDTDGSFGDGASFFGSQFPSQIHQTLQQQYHSVHNFMDHGGHQGGYSCQTIKKYVNGMLMTQTSCG